MSHGTAPAGRVHPKPPSQPTVRTPPLSHGPPAARAATAPARGADPVLDPPRHKLTLT